MKRPTFIEFFAGGGLARAGLGPAWRCVLANDVCTRKAATYADNWGGETFALGDVAALDPSRAPGRADLAWASFPCQDLSLAGRGDGLRGARSAAFWGFWRLVEALRAEARAPRLVVLENVLGFLTSRGGRDFAAVLDALAAADYSVGAMVIDAADFTPQSRPRVFIVAADKPAAARAVRLGLASASPASSAYGATSRLAAAVCAARADARGGWLWWRPPPPNPSLKARLEDIIETGPNDVAWDSPHGTRALVAMMAPLHRARLDAVKAAVMAAATEDARRVGALYRRTRSVGGDRVQRAEIRFDGLAGCLRTPAGGSSRQRLIIVDRRAIRTRLMSARELARLMGLGDDYRLPANYNEAYRLLGDGVAPPVVRYLSETILEPLLGVDAVAA